MSSQQAWGSLRIHCPSANHCDHEGQTPHSHWIISGPARSTSKPLPVPVDELREHRGLQCLPPSPLALYTSFTSTPRINTCQKRGSFRDLPSLSGAPLLRCLLLGGFNQTKPETPLTILPLTQKHPESTLAKSKLQWRLTRCLYKQTLRNQLTPSTLAQL